MLTARLAIDETKTYTIRNVDQKSKTLIIEHPERVGYKLLGLKPAETTANAYRFEVKLAADGTEKFPVAEERLEETVTSVSSLTPDALLAYSQNKALSESARNQLQQVLDSKRQTADLDAQIRQLDNDISSIVTDQTRIRENLRSLNQVSGQQDQVQKYARQLATQESTLATSRDRVSDLRKQKATEESRLNALIEKLAF
jgi:chromosome segregation ATPase